MDNFLVSGAATANTSVGRNRAYASGTATYDITNQHPYYAVSQSDSLWHDTFYVHSNGTYTIDLKWFIEAQLSSGPDFALDASTLQYSLRSDNSQNVSFSEYPNISVSDQYENFIFTPVGGGNFFDSGILSVTGNGDGAFVLQSQLRVSGVGNFIANAYNTAGIDSVVVEGDAQLTTSSGILKFDGTKYVYEVASVPEPSTYTMLMAGLFGLGAMRKYKNRSA